MPAYNYYCDSCEKCFELNHSVGETVDVCPVCNCSDKELFRKIYNNSSFYNSISVKFNNEKPGKVVDKFIKETKEELRDYKKELKGLYKL